MCVRMYTCHSMYSEDNKTTCRSQFFPFTVWGLGIELGLLVLALYINIYMKSSISESHVHAVPLEARRGLWISWL